MPNKNGYLPLGQDEQDTPYEEQESQEGADDTRTPAQTHNTNHAQAEHEGTPQRQGTVTLDRQSSNNDTRQSSAVAVSKHQHQQHQQQQPTLSTTTATATATAPTIQQSTVTTIQTSQVRPTPYMTVSAPVAGTEHSNSSTFQFTGFGTKHKSLLGTKDKPSMSSSSNSNGHSSYSSGSAYARLTGSNPDDNSRAPGGGGPGLAHLRPKQHPHTTHSGPRGIEESQKREVLREIRPDPHNLPEELLREQARSGAAVDAIANGGLYPQDGGIHPLTLPGSPGSNPAGHVTGAGIERRTLLGAGDGLGLGIGLGGKANTHSSRWNRPSGRRQRRVPSSGLGREYDQRVIQSSVFTPVLESVDGRQPVKSAPALTPDHAEAMTSERFVSIVNSVKEAIHSGIQPLRIAQGSSGSYFCRNTDGKIVGVFKPKNEEPYGQLNPKWAKWIHRNLFPCCFGRSCLIPNLGYISEAATSLVDRRLKLNIVPSTEVVWLSSSAFHYDYLDRRAAKLQKGAKPLPDKVGSFQLFLNGFKDANLFMRDHPWPVESAAAVASVGDASGAKGKYSSAWRRSSPDSAQNLQDTDGASTYGSITGSAYGGLVGGQGYGLDKPGFNWTPPLQQQFREQFEKMIILDYLIRNTDRGLDNWMIRYCEKEGISIVASPLSAVQKGNMQQQADTRRNSRIGDLLGLSSDRGSLRSLSSSLRESGGRNGMLATPPGTPPRSNLSQAPTSGVDLVQDEDTGGSSSRSGSPEGDSAAGPSKPLDPAASIESYYGSNHVHVAAIDNGLAFPFKHPDSWRSYPYGWLFLPRHLISQPFTKATRDHFLPLLSSPVWWRETIADLRRLFSIDSDFDQGMFDKQMAVMKGQGWNIVETLKNLEHGPMDLCRRVALVVWDEEVTLEPGVSPSMLNRLSGQLSTEGPGGVTYTNAQPKAMTMDASKASYTHYGSIMSVGDRLSTAKTLSTSSTAIGEGTPFLKYDHLQAKQGSLQHLVIDMEEDAMSQPRHDSFRQVVSDGEYDDDDDDDDDEDAFSYDEEYDDFDEELEVGNSGFRQAVGSGSQTLAPVSVGDMVSIDMTLTNPEAARSHRRRASQQSEEGRSRSRRRQRSSSDAVQSGVRTQEREEGEEEGGGGEDPRSGAGSPRLGNKKSHQRSRTEQDHRTGTIRFESTALSPSVDRSRADSGDLESGLLNTSSKGRDPFKSPEDDRVAHRTAGAETARAEEEGREREQEQERGRGRGVFARGYGAISSPGGDSNDSNDVNKKSDDGDDEHGLSGRPRWADRLKRGLSFDGHLLVGGIGQAARRDRKLRKQRQRERELRERRVILVERIEPVTKNLPYFKWW